MHNCFLTIQFGGRGNKVKTFLCPWGVQERGFCVHGECRREVFVFMGSAGERFLCSWGVQEVG